MVLLGSVSTHAHTRVHTHVHAGTHTHTQTQTGRQSDRHTHTNTHTHTHIEREREIHTVYSVVVCSNNFVCTFIAQFRTEEGTEIVLIKAKDFWKVNKKSWYGVLCLCASVKNNSMSSGNKPSLNKVWAILNFDPIGPPSRNGMKV